MADVRIRVIGEDRATQELAKIDSSLGGLKRGVGDVAGLFVKVTGVVTGAAVVMKKAFDLGAQGAAVLQTAESFELLLQKVGAAPNLLNQLREASKGTIADMQLMSATSTLLAGAQGDLATALANATPQLMEIAKASNKLNPSLGDTAFMYQSLATGIKRASPLILDNLGLTIKIEEAYTKYAATLGKSATALTAEEQKMALLNATLDAGKVLIDQVGGSTDSATDSFQQLEAATKNLSDRMKADLGPMLTNAAKALYDLMTWSERLVTVAEEHSQAVLRTSSSYEAYKQELERAAATMGYLVDKEGNLVEISKQHFLIQPKLVQANYVLTEAEYMAAKAAEFHTWAQQQQTEVLIQAATAAETLQAKINQIAEALLRAGMEGKFGKALESYNEQMSKLRGQAEELRVQLADELAKGFDDTSKSVRDLTDKLNENQTQQEKLEAQVKRTTAEIIFQRVAALLDAESALVLAHKMGLLSDADFELEKQLIRLIQRFDENADGLIDNAEKTDYLVRMTLKLYQQVTQNIGVVDAYAVSMDNLVESQREAIETAYLLELAQGALQAGLAGQLLQASVDYEDELKRLKTEQDKLIAQYWALISQGADPYSDAMQALSMQISGFTNKQYLALEAMRKTTAQMIYQQASQGLSADAALELARSMGMISEKDYKVAAALQKLRAMYDSNKDGAIDAAEGAMEYVEAIKRLYNEVIRLMELGLPFDINKLLGAAGGGGNLGNNPPLGPVGNYNVVNFYFQPEIAFADLYQFEQKVRPIVEQIFREHGV